MRAAPDRTLSGYFFSADTTAEPDSWTWTVTRPGAPTPEVTARTPEFDHAFSTPGVHTVSLTITKGIRTAQSSRQFTVAQGAVKAWGSNAAGALEVPAGAASGVIAIDAGFHHVLALKADGSVLAWGANDFAQTAVPPEANSGVVAISAGGAYSLALKADGSVISWGVPGFPEPGDCTPAEEDKVPPAAQAGVISIATNYDHSLALKRDGTVVSWGVIALFLRYSSLASLVAALFAPFATALLLDFWSAAIVAVMSAFLVWRHKGNIQRLLAGTEPRLAEKKPTPVDPSAASQ